MDMITLAMAKAYTDSQRLGYTEPGKVLTYDGNKTGKPVILDALVKISDTPIDVSAIESITFGGNVLTKDDFTLMNQDALSVVLVNEETLLISAAEDADMGDGSIVTKGVWVMHTDFGYGSEVVFAETIHPINAKYVAKIIDLNKYNVIVDGETKPMGEAIVECILSGGNHHLETEDLSAMRADCNTDSQLVVQANLSAYGVTVEAAASKLYLDGSLAQLAFSTGALFMTEFYKAAVAIALKDNVVIVSSSVL